MHPLIKKLASQTAIYGLSSIAGRLLNYLLVPLHTRIFNPGEYGVVTEFYAYVAFLNILFTYGMETAFFRYSNLEENKKKVYDTSLLSLLFTTLTLVAGILIFSQPIATAIRYPDHADYIIWFTLILGLAAISDIPFARLRQENRPIRFATFKLVNIITNVAFNVFFLLLCPYILATPSLEALHGFISLVYYPELGVGYVFISNLIASIVTMLALWKYVFVKKWEVDFILWKKMMGYALPLILVGLAGMVDETLSRILLKYRLEMSPEAAMHELGIFGACYKLSILMTLFIQAYRMAAEPFFFGESKKTNPQFTYARTMNFFSIFCCFIFLFVMLFIDAFKMIFIGPQFYEGVKVVPILLLANFFLGVYYNLTIWYKLTNQTGLGAVVAIYGAVVTIIFNWWLIPVFGYMGSAWVTLGCYGSMMIISYLMGQRYYPVPYDLKRFLVYVGISIGLYFLSVQVEAFIPASFWYLHYLFGVILLGGFAGLVYLFETGRIRVFKAIV